MADRQNEDRDRDQDGVFDGPGRGKAVVSEYPLKLMGRVTTGRRGDTGPPSE